MDENFLPPRLRFLQLLQFKADCASGELARDKRYRIINEAMGAWDVGMRIISPSGMAVT
jgi:hypothetical protein